MARFSLYPYQSPNCNSNRPSDVGRTGMGVCFVNGRSVVDVEDGNVEAGCAHKFALNTIPSRQVGGVRHNT